MACFANLQLYKKQMRSFSPAVMNFSSTVKHCFTSQYMQYLLRRPQKWQHQHCNHSVKGTSARSHKRCFDAVSCLVWAAHGFRSRQRAAADMHDEFECRSITKHGTCCNLPYKIVHVFAALQILSDIRSSIAQAINDDSFANCVNALRPWNYTQCCTLARCALTLALNVARINIKSCSAYASEVLH